MAEGNRKPQQASRRRPAHWFQITDEALKAGIRLTAQEESLTTLTRWLQLETWTPTQAVQLVNGIDPQGVDIPSEYIVLLDMRVQPANIDAVHYARRLLQVWNAQVYAPVRMRPSEWVEWFKSKGVDTEWLADVPTMPPVESTAGNVDTTPLALPDKTKNRDAIDPIIEDIVKGGVDPNDTAAMWNAIVDRANAGVPPLLAAFEGKVKYQTARGDKYLTRAAVRKRLQRRR